jgi:hypothetical protein
MFSIVKTALAMIVLGSVSVAPAFAAHRHHAAHAKPSFQNRDVSLSPLAVPGPAEEQWFDRATQGTGAGK